MKGNHMTSRIKLGLLTVTLAGLCLSGCALFGTNASDPGKFDQTLYQTTNVPVVLNTPIVKVVTVTNTVQVPVTNVYTVFQTNAVGVAVPVYQTNVTEITRTNIVQATNTIPAGTTVMVPQLVAPSTTQTATIGAASGVAGFFGYGGLVSIALSGLGHWYQKSRNNALMAKYTGASTAQQVASQAAGALTQQVDTLLEILKGTPQGQQLLPHIQSFLASHSIEAGVAQTIAQMVQSSVNNADAREAAGDILKVINLKPA
jgi:hypothetical protein